MNGQGKARGDPPGGDFGRASLAGLAAASTAATGQTDLPKYTILPPCLSSESVTTCENPVLVAGKRALAAEMYASLAARAGDRLGRLWWLQRRAMHLARIWALTHKAPEGQGVSNE